MGATILRLVDENGNCMWKNKTPNSHRWCRPIHVSFSKETVQLSQEWTDNLKDQVNRLETFYIKLYGKRFEITYEVYLTMIDGLMKIRLTDFPTSTN